MQGKGEKGEQARDYFIAVEDKLKEIATKGITHNVKRLTITSRDIATMVKMQHATILAVIRDIISELKGLGFNASEFYTETTYVTRMNNNAPQFLCTATGCEYFSGRLEPEQRKAFIEEFQDRFERMQNVIDGKPMKKTPKLICMADVPEKEPLIKVFKNESGGIVLMDGDIYELEPEELYMLSRFVPEIEKTNIGQIQYAISAFLKSMKGVGKLEQVASFGEKQDEPPKSEVKALPCKTTREPVHARGEDLDSVLLLTDKQAQVRYSMSRDGVMKVANECNAVVRYGKRLRIDRKKLDEYLIKEYTE